MTEEEYNRLYEKYSLGRCTEEERKLVENYQDTFELSTHKWDTRKMGDRELVRDAIISGLQAEIKNKNNRVINLRTWIAAASITVLISSGLLYLNKPSDGELVAEKKKMQPVQDDIAPGANKAILVLDDGSIINLDDAKNGFLAKQSNTTIQKLPDGRLHYAAGSSQPAINVRYNSVSTPRGGQFQITLPDGSKVWLNAGSTIRFPTTFTGMERRVQLTGEAYFEIAKNALMPLEVSANNLEVKVLGTHFNVMAYDDEKNTNTTLLEGSVQVTRGQESKLIKPGQAVVVNKSTGSVDVIKGDLEQAVAWKNGYFIFDDENIESIMRKVSRWYDVDVSYKGNMDNKDFTGTISRNEKVSELLKMLELTGAIHFKIIAGDASGKGRRITVMP